MAKETRPDFTYKWASSGTVVAPSSGKVSLGWVKEKPTQEYWNYLENRQDQGIAYLFQQGLPEWNNAIEYQAGSSFVSYLGKIYKCNQTGSNKTPSSEPAYWSVVTNGINVKEYGAVGNNVIDDSLAFTNAIAAASSVGGLVIVPTDNDEVYRVNITILKSGITLRGTNRARENGSSIVGLRPYTNGLPTITIGDDGATSTVSGVTVENLCIDGGSSGEKGVLITGSVSHVHFNDIYMQHFTNYQISIDPAAGKAVSYIYFNGLSLSSSKSGSTMFRVDAGKGTSATYASAIFIDNYDFRSPATGTVIYNKEGTISMSNGWVQCNDDGAGTSAVGIKLVKDAVSPIKTPAIVFNGVSIDSTSSAHVLIDIEDPEFVGGTAAVVSKYLRGTYTCDGKVRDYADVDLDIIRQGYHHHYRPVSYAGTLLGEVSLGSIDDPTTAQATMSAAGGLLVLDTTAGLNLNTGGSIQVAGTNVLGTRITGWGAPTGSNSRATFATYTAPTISVIYNHSEVQAMADHIQVLSQRLAALITDNRIHGIIGD